MVKTYKEIMDYWMYQNSDKNLPEQYIDKEKRSFLLVRLIKETKILPKEQLMEIGCNVGRNLSFLFLSGYWNLSAVEIDIVAIDKLREIFPYLRNIPVYNCAIENFDYFKVEPSIIFTMATLQHIHPKVIHQVARDMMNNARKFLITIEDESRMGKITFKRCYKDLFHIYPFKQIKSYRISKQDGLPKGFVARIFKKVSF